MDNLSAHKQKQVRRLLAARQCRLWYLPPDSPDLNPMELAWSKRKTFLRGAKARLRPALEEAVARDSERLRPKMRGTGFVMAALPYSHRKIAIEGV
jgi:transposase